MLNLEDEIAAAPVIEGYEVRMIDPQTVEVDVESQRGLNELFQRLSERGLRVVSLRNKANRLEELFMRLVENKGAAVPDGRTAG